MLRLQRRWEPRASSGRRTVVLAVLAAMVVASCTSSSSTSTNSPSGSSTQIANGGVYRVGVTTFGNTDGLDPDRRIRIRGGGSSTRSSEPS